MKTPRRSPSSDSQSEGRSESRVSALRRSTHGRFVLPLAAHEQAEVLAKKKGGSAVETFLVKPDYAYPNTRMNRDQLRAEMNKPSAYFHDLRLPSEASPSQGEIGLLKLEILQCFGLPRLDAVGENDTFCIACCGSYAFRTDTMPPVANPMWLSKMRRACVFPLYHAYARLYIGVFDEDGEAERDDFAGRVVLDISRMRQGTTYDVTLPLRQSAQVYMRRPRGSIRFRFHLTWYNERDAMLSYIPKGLPKFEPHERVTVNCCDRKSFQNATLVVHGTHPPGRFSMKLVRSLVREINFTRIHILRYLRKRELRNLVGWKNPIISAFLFCSWMHSVYASTVRYVPGNLITFLLLYLWKNYANYAINESLHHGLLPPTWEEMLMALLYGTDGRQYIQPLEMSLDEDGTQAPAVVVSEGSVRCSTGCSIEDIAVAFQKGMKLSTHRFHLRAYRQTFTGCEGVDFLIDNGYASSREEAVAVGRHLAEEKKLFEHVHRKQAFRDGNFFYHFTIQDDSKYKFTTHEPMGKSFFRTVGFLDEGRNFADDQLEMPYSNGEDHPRFTVKESLVIRSKNSKSMMEKLLAEDEDDADAADLDIEGPLDFGRNMDPRQLDRFDSYFDLRQRELPSGSIEPPEEDEENRDDAVFSTVKVLKKPPLQDIDFKAKSDRPISDVLAEARDKVHGVLLHSFNDRTYVIRDKETCSKSVETTSTSETTSRSSSKKGSWRQTSLDSLPIISESSVRDKPVSAGGSRRIIMASQRKSSKSKSSKRSSKSDAELARDENDRLLKIGAYSNANRYVAKLGVIVEPIVEIAYEWLYLFRALFNVFTWQDPILSFWVSVIGPIAVIVLHLFPWRPALGVAGVVLFGPQNWLFRVIRERKGIVPPDMDIIVKSEKLQPCDSEMANEPLFCSATDENRPLDHTAIDQTKVKHVAVPYSQLMYSNRFYDWPPESEYARVMREDPQSASLQHNGHADVVASETAVVPRATSQKGRWRRRLFARRSNKKQS